MAETSVTAFVLRIGRALFRDDDEFAWQCGWQIQVGGFGLSWAYRHRGFELLVCGRESCGTRRYRGADCGRCAGTGHAMLGRPSADGRRWRT
jgi:hypothetical protein